LRAEISGLLGKANLGTGRQILKSGIEHAVAMKVHEPSVIGLDAAVAAFGVELADAAMRGPTATLDMPPPPALVILELASGSPECIPQCDVAEYPDTTALKVGTTA
jgi:hypothetical protein